MALTRVLARFTARSRTLQIPQPEGASGAPAGGIFGSFQTDLFHILALVTVIVAVALGNLTIPQTAAVSVPLLLAGYIALLMVGPRWVPLLRRADLIVVLDLVVVTALLAVSGDLNSPFMYLYYLVILEGVLRLPLRQALGASVASAALIILLWLYAGNAEVLRDAGFRLGAVIAGGFLLALFLGTLVQEHQARQEQSVWAARLDQRLREATRQLEVQLVELQFYNDLASQLSGELHTDGVTRTLLRFFLKATGLAHGAAYLIADNGEANPSVVEDTAQSSAPEASTAPPLTFPAEAAGGDPIVLDLPETAGASETAAVCVPLVRGGATRAWLCGLSGGRPGLEEATRRLVRRLAAEGTTALEAALLYEEVQRIVRADPMRSLFAWSALEKLVAAEIDRCRELSLEFSVAEIQLENSGAGAAPLADRELALRRAVNLIRASLRRVDLLSYDGAGRFAILLPRMPKGQAADQVQGILAKVESDPVASRLLLVDRLVMAAGVVTFPEDGADESSLFAAVEDLLIRGASRPARVQVPAG